MIIIILFTLTVMVNSLSPANFCFLPNNVYKEVKCKEYQCKPQFCSTDELKCQALQERIKSLDSMLVVIIIQQNFVPYIRRCTSDQYALMKSQVCQNKHVCYEIETLPRSRLMFKRINVKLSKQCPCKGTYGYDCSNGYCALDRQTCQMFNNEMFKEIVKKIKTCE